MRHEAISPPTFDLRRFAKSMVQNGIKAAPTAEDMKHRIMLARQCGFLSDDEAEEWIVTAGLIEK